MSPADIVQISLWGGWYFGSLIACPILAFLARRRPQWTVQRTTAVIVGVVGGLNALCLFSATAFAGLILFLGAGNVNEGGFLIGVGLIALLFIAVVIYCIALVFLVSAIKPEPDAPLSPPPPPVRRP